MNLTSLLKPERINLTLRAKKKNDVLKELISMIKEGEDAGLLYETLSKREELGSTGIGKGIAIPHCRSLLIDKLEVTVGWSAKGVDFDSIDKKPAHLFFLIVAPPQDPGNQYLITLGRIAMVCQELTKKKYAFEPKSAEEFIQLIRTLEEKIHEKTA